MTLTIYPDHSKDVDSKSRPKSGTDRNIFSFPLYFDVLRIRLKPKLRKPLFTFRGIKENYTLLPGVMVMLKE